MKQNRLVTVDELNSQGINPLDVDALLKTQDAKSIKLLNQKWIEEIEIVIDELQMRGLMRLRGTDISTYNEINKLIDKLQALKNKVDKSNEI